jgi:hypothetical protein
MTPQEMRSIAITAIRSYLRTNGKDPAIATLLDVQSAFDYLARRAPDLAFSRWYESTDDQEWSLWVSEWLNWQKSQTLPDQQQ